MVSKKISAKPQRPQRRKLTNDLAATSQALAFLHRTTHTGIDILCLQAGQPSNRGVFICKLGLMSWAWAVINQNHINYSSKLHRKLTYGSSTGAHSVCGNDGGSSLEPSQPNADFLAGGP